MQAWEQTVLIQPVSFAKKVCLGRLKRENTLACELTYMTCLARYIQIK